MPFLKVINLKVNAMAQLEFELADYDVAAHRVNCYSTESLPSLLFYRHYK